MQVVDHDVVSRPQVEGARDDVFAVAGGIEHTNLWFGRPDQTGELLPDGVGLFQHTGEPYRVARLRLGKGLGGFDRLPGRRRDIRGVKVDPFMDHGKILADTERIVARMRLGVATDTRQGRRCR